MKKMLILMAAIAVFYSSTADSRVCFLPDSNCIYGSTPAVIKNRNCKEEGYTVYKNSCQNVTYEACNDKHGNWYKETGCKTGYTDMKNEENANIYDCTVSPECGRCCPNDKVKCKKRFKICENSTYAPDIPNNEKCREPNSDVEKRTMCYCDKNIYPYSSSNCGGVALTTSGNYCKGDNGTFYQKCTCNSSYKKTHKDDIVCPTSCWQQKCEDWYTYNLPGSSSYVCWSGAECMSIPECKYYDQKSCKLANFNSNCVEDINGCWNATTCNGYKKASDCKSNEQLANADANGCGTCVLSCTHSTEASCKQAYAHSNCRINSKGCWEPSDCATNYSKSTECDPASQQLKNADGNGCGTCSDKDCSGYIKCTEGFVGSGDKCVNTQGTFWEKCLTEDNCYKTSKYRTDSGMCDYVLPASEANTAKYLNGGGYYQVETCSPVDATLGKYVRIDSCNNTSTNCVGGQSPVLNYSETPCLNKNDGDTKKCGGKTYYGNCKCNNKAPEDIGSTCKIFEVSKNIAAGEQVEINGTWYQYVGVKSGCDGYGKQYGYYTKCSLRWNYCEDYVSGSPYYLVDFPNIGPNDLVDTCEEDEICPESAKSYKCGPYTHCSEKCVKQSEKEEDKDTSLCGKYNTYQHTGSSYCEVQETGTELSGYTQLGYVPGTNNKCSYFSYCSDFPYCRDVGHKTAPLPENYSTCTYPAEGADVVTCGGKNYYNKKDCCTSQTGCSVTNDKATLDKRLSNGYYRVKPSDVNSKCYFYASCTSDSKDCTGKYSPVKERKTCASYLYEAEITECGGKLYPLACAAECTYDKTPNDCQKLGKKFEVKCIKGNVQLGKCV